MKNNAFGDQIFLFKQNGQKDSDYDELFKIIQQNKRKRPSNVQHIWLSSQNFNQILYGAKIPDRNNISSLTKSTFLRKFQKISSKNQIGLVVFQNFEILNDDQKQCLYEFLLDLKDDFLKINNIKIHLKQNIFIMIRVHNLQYINEIKLSKQINIYHSQKFQQQFLNNLQFNQQQDQILDSIRINLNDGDFFLNLGRYGNNVKIKLSQTIMENHQELILQSNQLMRQYNSKLQIKNKIKYILDNIWDVLLFSTDNQVKRNGKITYQNKSVDQFMNFYAQNFIGQDSFSLLNQNQVVQLKNHLQKIKSQNDLSPTNINRIRIRIKDRHQGNNVTNQNKLKTGFGALVDKQGIQNSLNNFRNKCIQMENSMRFPNLLRIQQIEKIFFQIPEKIIFTRQSIKILAKCQQVIEQNSIFLVLQGPTGVGKSHVPKIYSFLTQSFKQDNKMMMPKDKYGNIVFHQNMDQFQLSGKYTVKGEKLQFDDLTVFKRIVEAGGIILLSQLNTVVKNRQATLAWWLKQIENAKPDQNGDRIIQLQSIYTHNEQLHKIRIKKGTLIIIDINSKDYLGRANLPNHFAVNNRLKINPLITKTDDQIIIQKQIKILAKYIKFYWNQQINSNNQRQYEQKQRKYQAFAKIMRDIVISYENKQFGYSPQTQKTKKIQWIFSIRQIERIIKDISYIQQNNVVNPKQQFKQVFYEQLALKWKNKQDRNKIEQILNNNQVFSQNKIDFNPINFFRRNLIISKRPVLWIMNQYQGTAVEQIMNLNLGITQNNILTFKMSYQVGQWEMFGGIVPSAQNPEVMGFNQGVFTCWLHQNNQNQQRKVLILQNINTMDVGSVSMLNNFLQNLETEKLYYNNKEYVFPKNGIIILVSREEINWSPAQLSRVIYFRLFQQQKKDQKVKYDISRFFTQISKVKQMLNQFVSQITIDKLKQLLFEQIKIYLQDKQQKKIILNSINFKNILQKINKKFIIQIEQLKKCIKQLNDQKKIFQQIQERLNLMNRNQQFIAIQQKQFKKKKKQSQLKILQSQRQVKEKNRSDAVEKKTKQDLYRQIKELKSKSKQLRDQIDILDQQIFQYYQNQNQPQIEEMQLQKRKIEQKIQIINLQIKEIYSKFKKITEQIYCNELNKLKEIQPNTESQFKYIIENNKIILMYNKEKYQTNHKTIPNLIDIKKKMMMTDQLARILQLMLYSFKNHTNVYLEGNPGVGKTKITEFIATLLNKKVFIFQMSANVQLQQMIGGLQPNYKNNKLIFQINRNKQLIKFIIQGGIYVLDEAALSIQAKQVISWFSQLVQKKPNDQICFCNIPGDKTKIKIHEDFHLVITGNDPKKVLSRKQLPKQVSYFVQTIKYRQNTKEDELIRIIQTMIVKHHTKNNPQIARALGKFHYQFIDKYSKNDKQKNNNEKMTNREMQKVLLLLNDKNFEKIKPDSQQFLRAVYQVYFARFTIIQKLQYKNNQNYKKYFQKGQKIKFWQNLETMSTNRRPLLIIYEQKQKASLIKSIKAKFSQIEVFKAMSCFTQENLLGGYAPDSKGQMQFQLSGLGSYFVQDQRKKKTQQSKEVLICDIHLVKQGVRTQLNQLLQDGYTNINGKKYYWPQKLKLIFTVSSSKIEELSKPYLSRHQQLRYKMKDQNINNYIKNLQAIEIENQLKKNQKFRIINFFGKEKKRNQVLRDFRRKYQQNYTKIFATKQLQQIDWMVQIQKKEQKFEINPLGLYKQLQKDNHIIQIVGLENNPTMINVIQSIIMNQWVQNSHINLMIPGFNKLQYKNVTIILNTQVQISKILTEFVQWSQVIYYQVIYTKKNQKQNKIQMKHNFQVEKKSMEEQIEQNQQQQQQKLHESWLDQSVQNLKKIKEGMEKEKEKQKQKQKQQIQQTKMMQKNKFNNQKSIKQQQIKNQKLDQKKNLSIIRNRNQKLNQKNQKQKVEQIKQEQKIEQKKQKQKTELQKLGSKIEQKKQKQKTELQKLGSKIEQKKQKQKIELKKQGSKIEQKQQNQSKQKVMKERMGTQNRLKQKIQQQKYIRREKQVQESKQTKIIQKEYKNMDSRNPQAGQQINNNMLRQKFSQLQSHIKRRLQEQNQLEYSFRKQSRIDNHQYNQDLGNKRNCNLNINYNKRRPKNQYEKHQGQLQNKQQQQNRSIADQLFKLLFNPYQQNQNKNGFLPDVDIQFIWEKQLFYIMNNKGSYSLNQIALNVTQQKFSTISSSKLKRIDLSMKQHQFYQFESFIKCIKRLQNIIEFNINLSSLKQITDQHVKDLLDNLRQMENLKKLSIDLSQCPQITQQTKQNIEQFLRQTNIQLQSLSLNFCLSQKISSQYFDAIDNQFQLLNVKNYYGSIHLRNISQQKLQEIVNKKMAGIIVQFSLGTRLTQIIKILQKLKTVQGLNSLYLDFSKMQTHFPDYAIQKLRQILKHKFKYLKRIVFFLYKNQKNQQLMKLVKRFQKKDMLQKRNRDILSKIFKYSINDEDDQRMNLMNQDNFLGYFSASQIERHNKKIYKLSVQLDDVWPTFTIIRQQHQFLLKEYIQIKDNYQFNSGYWSMMTKLHSLNNLMNMKHIIDMIYNLINRHNWYRFYNSLSQWNIKDSIQIFKKLDYEFQFNQKDIWNVKGCLQSMMDYFKKFEIIYQQNDKHSEVQQLQKLFCQMFRPLYNHLKSNSLRSKNDWLKFVEGNGRIKQFGKSGKFSVIRYLQRKKYFYYRNSKVEGDFELQKQMEADYQQLIKTIDDQIIKKKLEENPKLVLCLNDQSLIHLISTGNQRVKGSLNKLKSMIGKLKQNVNKAIVDQKIKDSDFLA